MKNPLKYNSIKSNSTILPITGSQNWLVDQHLLVLYLGEAAKMRAEKRWNKAVASERK
jgi:hypothetical protein